MVPAFNPSNLIFIHGMESSSQGYKAKMLRGLFPDMLIPDFKGPLDERMKSLETILAGKDRWTIIGSSLGGLMGAMFSCNPSNEGKVRKLILLAPALIWPDFAQNPPAPVKVPTVIFHGSKDELIPLNKVREITEEVFLNLTFHSVDDDHRLQKTVQHINWEELLR